MEDDTPNKFANYYKLEGYFDINGFHPYPSASFNQITGRFPINGLNVKTPNVFDNIPANSNFSQIQELINGKGIFNLANEKVSLKASLNSPLDFSKPFNLPGFSGFVSTDFSPFKAIPTLAKLGHSSLLINSFENLFKYGTHPLSTSHFSTVQSLLAPTNMPMLNNVTTALGEHQFAASKVNGAMYSSVISQTFQHLAFQKPNCVIDGSINRFIEAVKLGEHGITYISNSKSILNDSLGDFTAFVKELHPLSAQGMDKMFTQNTAYLKPYHTVNDGIFYKATINFDKLFPNSYKDYKLYSPLVTPSNEFKNAYWIDVPQPETKIISKPKVDDDKYLKLINRIQGLERQNALQESSNDSITQEIKCLTEEVIKLRLELAAFEIKNSEMDDHLDNNGVINLLKISARTFYRYKDNWTVHLVGSKRLYKKSEIILSIKKFAK